MTKKILFILIFIHSSLVFGQDPRAVTSLVNCASLFRLYSDISGSKDLNGFSNSRPEWKETSLKQFYNTEEATSAKKSELEALRMVKNTTGNVDLSNASAYYYDKWAIEIQEDFNISPVRAKISFGRYRLDCLRVVDLYTKIPISKQDYTELVEANKYSSAKKNESKNSLLNLQKIIPRTDRYLAINIKLGLENEAKVEIDQWLKKYNLQIRSGKSGDSDNYLSKEGFSTIANIIGPINPNISDQILTNKSGPNFYKILDKFGKTSDVEKDVFDRSKP